jgi:flagellar basal body-associated protein FliL
MPIPKSDDEPFELRPSAEPPLEPKVPPKRRGTLVWVVLMLLLLVVLAGALFLSARVQFERDYARALNNIMLQQGDIVATMGAGK